VTAFATTDELATYLGLSDGFDATRAQLMLDIASENIRNYTRQLIDRVTAEAASLPGNGMATLLLPELPATVTDVALDTLPLVPDQDYRVEGAGKLRRLPVSWCSAVWPLGSVVAVTYSHGYEPVPEDIKGVCLRTAGRSYRNPEAAASQSITNYAVTYGSSAADAVSLSEGDERILDRYRVDP
jgi:hypothetical protein